ncbi:DUF4194 domain-containing protein [Thiohalorhabdus methylotrophus]|uniref:DUF4194 domain-containing protein n=1 Tax=Thiohalorhabdus methylotrophus TaxID=3242694 RepID=A0ABV4TUK9_9GAMM
MLKDLMQAVNSGSDLEAEDFRRAAQALLSRQFLFLANKNDRQPYRLIKEHMTYFGNLVDALGWTLVEDSDFQYVGVVTGDTAAPFRKSLKREETLLLLGARFLFERGLENMEAQEGGVVWVDAQELATFLQDKLGLSLPPAGRFKETLKLFRRHGLVRIHKDGTSEEVDRIRLELLPSLRRVTGGPEWRQRLEKFAEVPGEEPAGAEGLEGEPQPGDEAESVDASAEEPELKGEPHADAD